MFGWLVEEEEVVVVGDVRENRGIEMEWKRRGEVVLVQ